MRREESRVLLLGSARVAFAVTVGAHRYTLRRLFLDSRDRPCADEAVKVLFRGWVKVVKVDARRIGFPAGACLLCFEAGEPLSHPLHSSRAFSAALYFEFFGVGFAPRVGGHAGLYRPLLNSQGASMI